MFLRLYSSLFLISLLFTPQIINGQSLKPEFDKKSGLYGYKNSSTGKWQILPQFEKAGPFLHNRAIIKQRTKEGLIDSKGKIIVKPQFVELQGDSVFLFKKESDTIGLLNSEGKILVEGNYDHIEFNKDNNSAQLVKNDLYGYWDVNGLLIPPVSRYGIYFENGLAYFNSGTKIGYFNKEGEVVMEVTDGKLYLLNKTILHVYNGEESIYNLKGKWLGQVKEVIQTGNTWMVFSKEGKHFLLTTPEPVLKEYKQIQPFNKNGISIVAQDKWYGVIDTLGNIVQPFEYDTIQPLGNKFNRFTGEYASTYHYVLCKKDGLWGLMNDKGEVIQTPAYTNAYLENNILISEENKTLSIKDLTLSKAVPLEDIFVFNQGKAVYFFPENNKDKYGLINRNGKIAHHASFNSLRSLWNGLYIAETNRGVGIIDTSATVIVPCVFKELYILNDFATNRNPKNILFDNYVYALTKSGKTGVYSREGTKIVDTIWNDITLFDIDGKSFWAQDDKSFWQLILSDGKVKKVSLDNPVLFENKQAIASKKGKFGVVGSGGKTIIPFKYTKLSVQEDGTIISQSGNKWGIVSSKGKEIEKANYKYLLPEVNDFHLAFKKQWGIVKNEQFEEGYRELKPVKNGLYSDGSIQKASLNFLDLEVLDEYNLELFAGETELSAIHRKANDYVLNKVAHILLPETELKIPASIKKGKSSNKLSDQYLGKGVEILNTTDSTVSLNFYEEVSGRGFNKVTDHNLVLVISNGQLQEVKLSELFNNSEYKLFLNEVIAARLREADYRIIPSSKGDILYYDENYFQIDKDGLVLKVNEKVLDLTYDLVGPEVIINYEELESIVKKEGALKEFYKQ